MKNNSINCSQTTSNKMTIEEAVAFCLSQAKKYKGKNNPYINICELLLESKYKTNYTWTYVNPPVQIPQDWNHKRWFDTDVYCGSKYDNISYGTNSEGTTYGTSVGTLCSNNGESECKCGEKC